MADFTPMMQQYLKIKDQYRDAILFYRLGDFYEMFFDDAKTASKELELVLTGRDCGQEERAPMCGVPFHAADSYIAKLVAKGYKVAVCEQTEDPAAAKGIVTRDVIRIVTPGTVTDSLMLDADRNNYLAVANATEQGAGVAFCDISTGFLSVRELGGANRIGDVLDAIAEYQPSELITSEYCATDQAFRDYVHSRERLIVDTRMQHLFDPARYTAAVERKFGASLSELHLADKPFALGAMGVLLSYAAETQKSTLQNITSVNVENDVQYMNLGAVARQDLELTRTLRRNERKGSLLWVIDATKTSMGKRMLTSWVEKPLTDISRITSRHNAVEELYADPVLRSECFEQLRYISDLERVTTRIVNGNTNAKELGELGQTLSQLPGIKGKLAGVRTAMLQRVRDGIDPLSDVRALIGEAIADEPPLTVREGGMIRAGYNAELDELRDVVHGGRSFLADIEQREQARTGIKKLKIGYNRVFGYYIEVSNSFKDQVPADYVRKQTLTNCERFITQELKELEAKVLGAQDRIAKLEYEIFTAIREQVAAEQERLYATAAALATLDTLCSLAETAAKYNYVRPHVDNSDVISVKEGRHPVVERFLEGAPFVPNDVYLDGDENRTLIITGPNMAGKSTYMRQTALIVLLAQIGSFVPAASADIGVVDAIFTRIGASDDLIGGQSTFMAEMSEVASILAGASARSLVILDEIGRGTSTFDGMSIARAVLEYITDKRRIGARTLFATHYHELTDLETTLAGVKNFHTSVKRRGDDITFLRRIVRGAADGSYGIEVAKLAGIPPKVVRRAREILEQLEAGAPAPSAPAAKHAPAAAPEDGQLGLFGQINDAVVEELRNMDLNTFTPLEALTKLYELKNKIV